MNAVQHLEAYLGPVDYGWSSESLPGIQICLFRNKPSPGVLTITTLGLSNTVLSMDAGRRVRQELVVGVTGDEDVPNFAKLLLHVADQLLSSRRALLRGDVVALPSSVALGSAAEALYASIPTAYPDEFWTLDDSSPPTVFVWLFPLLPSEASFVANEGWDEFEIRLEERNCDPFDVRRIAVA
jgi:hypothetical protein